MGRALRRRIGAAFLRSRPVQQQDKDQMNPRSSQQSAEGDSRRFPPAVTDPRADLALGVPMIR